MIIVQSQAQLLEIVLAARPSAGFSSRLNRRQQQGDQHADNGNDYQQFNECECASHQGAPHVKDRLSLALSRLRGVYSDNLIEVVEWCMSLDPLSRPQSVFALQKELSREGERRYTKLSVGEKMRLQFDNMVSDTKKRTGIGAKTK